MLSTKEKKTGKNLRGTHLGQEYQEHPFPVMTLTEYGAFLIRCLKLLHPETAIHRITGNGLNLLLIEPKWCGDKKHVLNTLYRMIREA